MYSNLFMTRDIPLQTVTAHHYTLKGPIDPKDFYRVSKGLENRFLRRGVSASIFGDKVLVVSDRPLSPEEKVADFTFVLGQDCMTLLPSQHQGVLQKLVSNSLKIRALSLGYVGPESGKYYKEAPYRSEFFTFHEAFSANVEVFSDGRVGVWLDPTTRWKQKISNFISWASRHSCTQGEIRKRLIGKSVYCPSVRGTYFKAEIADVTFKRIDVYEIVVGGVRTTIYQFWTQISQEHAKWLKKNRVSLNPQETPVITVQSHFIPERLSFPPGILELVIDLEDPTIPPETLREKKVLSPSTRIDETKKLAVELVGKPLLLGSTQLDFVKDLLEWTSDLGRRYAKIAPLKAPSLVFGGKNIATRPDDWSDPDIRKALLTHGPVTSKEELTLNYLIPSELESLVDKFHTRLGAYARALKLGTYSLGRIETIEREHPDRYRRACRALGSLSRNRVVVVVLPSVLITQAYYAAKWGLGEQQTKSQMLKSRTFEWISKWDGYKDKLRIDSILYNLSAQVYDKSLAPGESIWHLANPTGGIDPRKTVYFMGFDVSRAPERRKEAAAYAAVCDSYGRILYRKAIDSHKGEKIQSNVLSDWFFDVASSAYDETSKSKEKRVDELILFKDGPIRRNQLVDYRKGALDAKSRLMNEGIMKTDANIRVISVTKRGPHRIYGKSWKQHKVRNTSLLRDESNAVIVTTEAHQGTALPLKLRLEYQLVNDMDIKQVVQIFNDLRYLDYTSLYKQPKTILPLHIVQNLAKLSKEDISVPYVPR